MALAAVAAVVLGGAAAGAAAPRVSTAPVDPLRQVLQRGDFPAGADYERDLGLDGYLKTPLKAAGLSGYAGSYLGATYSKAKGFEQVSGVVITVASPAAARRAFRVVKKARVDLMARIGKDDWRARSLPRYGDEQAARVSPPGNEGIGVVELIVRKQRVVWLLVLSLERRPKPPVAEIVADTRGYAAKQQRRVGAG